MLGPPLWDDLLEWLSFRVLSGQPRAVEAAMSHESKSMSLSSDNVRAALFNDATCVVLTSSELIAFGLSQYNNAVEYPTYALT